MTRKVHATGVIFEDKSGRILVLKRHSQSREGETWGLVGGNIENGENKSSTAIRESKEEIGYNIDPSKLEFLKTYHWNQGNQKLNFETFKVRSETDDFIVKLDVNENTEYMWASPQDLYSRQDLMEGLYPILEDTYGVRK